MQEARTDFERAVSLAADPDIPADAALVKDVARLAHDFLDLIRLNTPPVSARPLAFRAAVMPATKEVYDGSDREIVPPTVVDQRLPPWPPTVRPAPGTTGVVEVTINERGEVESAVMAPPFNSAYDELLLEAARRWRYRPALCGRLPVKFRRRVQVVAGIPDGAQYPEGHAQDAAAR
jgi:TonB family protein